MTTPRETRASTRAKSHRSGVSFLGMDLFETGGERPPLPLRVGSAHLRLHLTLHPQTPPPVPAPRSRDHFGPASSRTTVLKTSPRCSKLSNMSNEAQAGESSTASPPRASERATATASSIEPASAHGTPTASSTARI